MTGLIRDFIFINQTWKTKDPIKLLGTDITINPEDLNGEYDIDIDIGVSPSEKLQAAQQLDLLAQFATQAGIPMGLQTPLHLLNIQKKKYNLYGLNISDCIKNEQQFTQDQEAAKQQPKPDDWKEFLQVDKLFPLLTRSEQMQIIQKLGIQPDPQGQVAGIPQAKDLVAAQSKQQDNQTKTQALQQASQIKIAESQQKMGIERQKAMMDMGIAQQKNKIDMTGKVVDFIAKTAKTEKGNNNDRPRTN
jgi:hypothetical protein